ncbi:sulfotransferase domain-containing protein [Halioglobus maricola]|uniref:sulfotransferase domain-containing protein n=1 Tax=Halioglobus maricola TaxID=2601894 RepID=UPI001F0E52D1|nr:sulfotransferase domain-containing protein [Halioglobus maricola]
MRTIVSRKLAGEIGAWTSKQYAEIGSPDKASVILEVGEVREALEQTAMWEREVSERFSKQDILHLTYEDIVSSPEDSSREISEFLGVEYEALSTKLKKQNPERLEVLIENFDQLKDAFADTESAIFFDE